MKILQTLTDKDLGLDGIPDEKKKERIRQAARAVVFDKDGKVAILAVTKHSYHKTPGGGIEEGESIEEALRREVLEEIGCEVEIIGEIGSIIEKIKKFKLIQTSYCYLTQVIGEKVRPNFTQSEIDDGFEILWVKPEKAMELFENNVPLNYEGSFKKVRDLLFIKEGISLARKQQIIV